MNLRCHIVEDSVYSNFTVPINSGKDVEALQQLIKTADSRFKDSEAHLLRLYKVNVPARNLEDELKQVNWNQPLDGAAKISAVFRDPDPDPDNVHVVVMPQNVVLRCLVLGDTPADIFEIDISLSRSVAALKAAVKQERDIAFKDTESAKIRLFKLSLPIDDALPGKLADLDITNLHELSPIEKISQLLEYPFDNLRIVVFPPDSASITCYVLGDPHTSTFKIPIDPRTDVADLKESIKDKDPRFERIAANLLQLHAVDILADNHLKNSLNTIGLGEPLMATRVISEVFHNITKGRVYVVVDPPSTLKRQPSGTLQNDQTKRPKHDFRQTKLGTVAPSTVALSTNYRILQADPFEKILDDRPRRDDDIAPIALLYDGFGYFDDYFQRRQPIETLALKSDVDKLCEAMTQFYPTEAARQDVGLRHLKPLLPGLDFTAIGKMKSDGHALGTYAYGGPSTIVEFKLEETNISAFPDIEASSYLAHGLAEMKDQELLQRCRIPCLLLTIVGPSITFYAAIAVGQQVRVVRLTPALSSLESGTSGWERESLYISFAAARKLREQIVGDFERHQCNPPPAIRNHRLPAISKLRTPNNPNKPVADEHISFQIQKYFPDRARHRELYIAQDTSNKEIVIKFSRRYSIELHAYCADKGHAPLILGFELLPGGWYGIAMEYIQEAVPISNPSLKPQLKQLVEGFHERGLVHGDLRESNILCANDRFWVIDFDWGGEAGKVEYPVCNLHPDLTAKRASQNRKIQKDDDLRVLDIILNRF